MTDAGDILGALKATAHDVMREVAERADLGGMKDALAEIERAGRKDRVDATVTSAVPLTDDERKAIEARLTARYGNDLPITYEVDPGILGGLVVRVGDRMVDGSVAAKLGRLRQSLTGTQ